MTIAVAFTVDYSARYEEQRGLLGHAHGRSLTGCVGEESEGETCGAQLSDSRCVAEKGRSMSGIGIAQRSELLVVTGNEGRTRVDATAHIDQPSVDPEAQFGHGIGFVDVRRRKKLESDSSEDFLGSDQEAAVVLASAGNVEQPDQNTFRADANGVVEVSRHTFSDEHGSDVGACDRGEDGWDRFQ
jgi:hypothetical protein